LPTMRLQLDYFAGRDSVLIAKDLLGKVFVHDTPEGRISGILCETEAYRQNDAACHAYGGRRTSRTEVMFWRSGHLYVYFTYGMYFCCNIVTGEPDCAEAVLIRGAIPVEGEDIMRQNRGFNKKGQKGLCDGPAKFAMAFGLDKRHNGVDLLDAKSTIYLEDRGLSFRQILTTPRIGISRSKELPWRFVGQN